MTRGSTLKRCAMVKSSRVRIAAVVPFADNGSLLIAGENGVSLFQPQ